jgi:hypothetical protein
MGQINFHIGKKEEIRLGKLLETFPGIKKQPFYAMIFCQGLGRMESEMKKTPLTIPNRKKTVSMRGINAKLD